MNAMAISDKVGIHFIPPAPTCSIAGWTKRSCGDIIGSIHAHSRNLRSGLRPRRAAERILCGCDGPKVFAVRNVLSVPHPGGQSAAPYVAGAADAKVLSPQERSLKEPANHCEIGITPCGL
jgi:hypothetical protein